MTHAQDAVPILKAELVLHPITQKTENNKKLKYIIVILDARRRYRVSGQFATLPSMLPRRYGSSHSESSVSSKKGGVV